MFGRSGADTFVVGDADNVFYTGNGNADFAFIQDFQLEQDLIRINVDAPEGYGFADDVNGNGLIFFNDDLIAAFRGVDIESILSSSAFEIVS